MNRHLWHTRSIGATCLALAACNEPTLTPVNEDPTATIVAPLDGATVIEGDELILEGVIADINVKVSELTHAWTVNGVQVCEGTRADDSGNVSCVYDVTADDTELAVGLEVVDDAGGVGFASVTVAVQLTEPPSLTVTSPERGGVYYSDRLIGFEGSVADAEDSPDDLTIAWTSSLDGDLTDVSLPPNIDGSFGAFRTLSEGEHALTATVTDTRGKSTTESFVVSVGATNTPPSCDILEPADGGSATVGEFVTFRGAASDPDVPASLLTVAWQSDADGVLSTSTPNTDGSVLFGTGSLSARTHTITMTVTDEVGESCSDAIFFTVGTPPTLSIVHPSDGESTTQGSSVSFEVEVSDAEDPSNLLTVEWSSSIDGVFDTRQANSAGIARFSYDGLSGGVHDLTVRVTDSTGAYADDNLRFTVDAWPSTPEIDILPAAPTTSDDLLAVVLQPAIDPEGSPVNLTWSWTKDFVPQPSFTGTEIPSSATQKGEVWRLSVTPDDGVSSGVPWEGEVTIANTPPEVGGVTLTPDPADEATVLTCAHDAATDADDDPVTVSLQWMIDGVVIAATGPTLTGAEFDRDDSVQCGATADDGETAADTVWSSPVTIVNAPPTVASVTIDPSPPRLGEVVSCIYAGFDDADGDADSSTLQWTVNGMDAGTDVELGQAVARGDELSCTVTPYDGLEEGAPLVAAVTVANTPPTAPVIELTPEDPTTDEDLQVTVTTDATDADGDAVSYVYVWLRNGVEEAAYSDATLPAAATRGNETWTVQVMAWDGYDLGDMATADVVVLNSAPYLTDVFITPTDPGTSDTLTCAYVGGDPDDDTLTENVTWYVNGAVFSQDGTPPGPGDMVRGDTARCELSLSDAEFSTAVLSSDTVTIVNGVPEILGVTVTPEVPYAGDQVTCVWSYADPDGDADASTLAWYLNDVPVGDGSPTLDIDLSRGDEVRCEVTPDDGVSPGTPVSDAVVVGNTPPGAPVISVVPSPASADDDLSCTIIGVASDIDDDPVTYQYAWRVDGQDAGITDSLVPADQTELGETWTCVVTSYDSEPGDSVEASEGPLGDDCTVLRLPSASARVEVQQTQALDVDTQATFAAWVRLDKLPASLADGAILDNSLGAWDCPSYGLYVAGESEPVPGAVVLKLDELGGGSCAADTGGNALDVRSAAVIEPNRWYHLAATYDAGTAKLFLNGILLTTVTGDSFDVGTPVAPLWLGGRDLAAGSSAAQTDLADVQIWSRTLSDLEIYELVLAGMGGIDRDGLLGWWQLNAGQGSLAADRSETEADGVLVGTEWFEECPSDDGDDDGAPGWLDCNDADDTIFPGASDYCRDGIDSDCNPLTPAECQPQGTITTTEARFVLDPSIALAGGVDLNLDGTDDLLAGLDAEVGVFYGGGPVGVITPDERMKNYTPERGRVGKTGGALAVSPDFTGDGVPDFIFGNSTVNERACGGSSVSYHTRGLVGLVAGDPFTSGTIGDPLAIGSGVDASYPMQPAGEWSSGSSLLFEVDYLDVDTSLALCGSTSNRLGEDVVFLDDIDGDGLSEFAVSSTRFRNTSTGVVFLVLSSDLATVPTADAVALEDVARLKLTGDTVGSFGTSVGAADVDGDGLDDLIIGSAGSNTPGVVHVVLGRDVPTVASDVPVTALASLTFTGVGTSELGTTVAGLYDIDGDGDEEFAVSAPGRSSDHGRVYIIPGFYDVNQTFSIDDLFPAEVTPFARDRVSFRGDGSGGIGARLNTVVNAGDINGDGYDDLLFGAEQARNGSTDYVGAAYLVYMGPNFLGDLWDNTGMARDPVELASYALDGTLGAVFEGTVNGGDFGKAISPVGDFDGDGYDDLAISSNNGTYIFIGGGS